MKAYVGVDVSIRIFLTSTLAVDEWLASRPGRFTSGEKGPGTHWIGGWVDPRAGLDDVEERKFLPGLEPTASFYLFIYISGPPPWSSGQSFWLQIQRSRVRFPALPQLLRSMVSGTGSTQPREDN
jgi:hypothetical protein